MPLQSRPDVSTIGVDILPEAEGIHVLPIIDDVIVDADEDVNNIDIFQDSSSDTSGISEPSSTVCSDKGETLFSPSLYLQRYHAVLSYLSTSNITSVLDTGCNNCRFLKFLQNMDNVRYIAGVDIDKGLLEEQARFLAPLPADWLHGRKEELVLEVWWGSVGDRVSAGVMTGRVEAVTSIEIIEHLNTDVLEEFPHTVLGQIKPVIWIVTTPNREYNSLFPDWVGPFRHWDHRFEWDRTEFKDWVEKVLEIYTDYTVEFGGVGFTDGCEDSHGPSSQIAVFRRSDETGIEENQTCEVSDWENIASYTFPMKVDNRTREERIRDEVVYYARMLATDIREDGTVEGNILVEIQELLRFDSLKKITEDITEICNLMEESGYDVDKEKLGIYIPEDPCEDDHGDEDYEYWDNEESNEFVIEEAEEWD